ncbi:Nickel-binding periplasmic protein precursor [Edwardsiella tarda]|nr:Nickel-binding periplasmic protein precursor [Edwardsiella tarda]
MIVEANPYYAGKKNDFNRLVFVFLDEDNAYAAAQSGQLDLVRIAPSMAVAPQQKNLKLWVRDSVENRGIVFPMVPAGKKDAEGNPIGNDVTADVAIRRAINYAINRQQLADQLMEGHAIPAYSAVQGLPWQNPDIAFKDGDLAKAKAILDQAGWKVGKDGIREKAGQQARLTLWYASGDSTRRDIARRCARCYNRWASPSP